MSTDPTIADMMKAYAEDAVDHANQKFGIKLDYSAESIRQVEEILDRLHRAIPRGLLRIVRRRPSDEILDTMCKMYGGYIGEVFRRSFGGTWELPTDTMGAGTVITFNTTDGSRFFPPSKVWKRLNDGEGDSVWFYFQVLSRDSRG